MLQELRNSIDESIEVSETFRDILIRVGVARRGNAETMSSDEIGWMGVGVVWCWVVFVGQWVLGDGW